MEISQNDNNKYNINNSTLNYMNRDTNTNDMNINNTTNMDAILQHQKEYYETNKKNMFFKKSQKLDCAETICNRMNLTDLMDQTFWIIPNTNQLYFDYRVLKLYGNPNNFMEIVDNVLRFCSWCVSEYSNFEINVNLSSFTVSAAERFRDIVVLFCEECGKRETRFSERLTAMNLYNTPNMIDQISKILMPIFPVEVRHKIRMFKKDESAEILQELYAKSGKIYTA
jgi:hypothetical protein